MTDLSPQAQAVLDAFDMASDGHYDDGVWVPHIRKQLAAALVAAADQVVPDLGRPRTADERTLYHVGRLAAAIRHRQHLLAIAAELRGQDQQTTEEN